MTATLLITNFSGSIIQTYSQIHFCTHVNKRFDFRCEQNVTKAESLKKDRKKVTKNHGWKLKNFVSI